MVKDQVDFLLNDAAGLFDNIANSYGDLESIFEIPIPLKVTIKRFLDNINSALDYTIVDVYQSSLIEKESVSNNDKNKLNRLQFPNKKNEEQFDNFFYKHFSSNIEKHIALKPIIESTQQYKDVVWLSDLKELSNGNKHRNLSTQHYDGSFHIKYLKYNGITMIDCYMNTKNAVGFGGQSLLDLALKNKNDAAFNVDAKVYFYFTDLNKELTSCLSNILVNSKETINSIYEVCLN